MWNYFLGIAFLSTALTPAVARVSVSSTASLQPNLPMVGRPIFRINNLKGSSSSSTSISSSSPPKLRQQHHANSIRKLPKEDETEAENPAMDLGGQTEDDTGASTANNDAELEEVCATATSDGAALTTDNNLSIQYEYVIFTDQADNINTVLDLGNQLNLKVTNYLLQLYILDFCLDYMGTDNNNREMRHTRRRLGAGDVRAVVPGDTALQTDQTCEAGMQCAYLTSSVTVHFATDYVIESADDVAKTMLKDVEGAFQDGLLVGANVAGVSYEGGSLETFSDTATTNDAGADTGNNQGAGNTGNTQTDNGGKGQEVDGDNVDGAEQGSTNGDRAEQGSTNGDGAEQGSGSTNGNGAEQGSTNGDGAEQGSGSTNADGAEQGSTNSGTAASVEVEDKMSRAGKFFLTVFILGLVGALIFVCWKLRRVAKVDGGDRGTTSRNGGDFREAVTDRVKQWRDRMQQWQQEASRCSDGSSDRIKLADTADDEEEEQHLRASQQFRAEVSHLTCRFSVQHLSFRTLS